MGFLSRLTFGQQSPWSALPWIQQNPQLQPTQPPERETPAWAQFAQEMQAAPPVTPQPRTQTPRRPAPISFTPQNAQALNADPTVAVPYMDAQGQRQMGQTQFSAAPGQSQAQVRPPSFSERLGTWSESPLLQMGLSLLGNADNGGDWGAVGQDLRQFGQDRTQRQRQQNEDRRIAAADRREETLFGRQQTMWGLEDRQRSDWEARVALETDPVRQAELRAIGQEDYGDWLGQERQMQFQGRENQLNRDADARNARVRASSDNSLGRYFQAMDAQTLGDLNTQAAQLQAVGIPQLNALRGTIQSASGLVGQPIDYNTRITLGRYFNGSSADRQTLEVWNAQILGPALETLRNLGAMSEREMEAAVNSFSNPNMTLGSAMQLLDERIATAQRRVTMAQAAASFYTDAGGITGVRNQSGQDWPTYLQEQLQATPGAGADERTMVPRGGYSAPPPAAIAELRRDSSAAARREFDQVFGPGAATRALGRPRPTPPRAAQGGRPGAF